MKKILRYFNAAIINISAQELLMLTATILSYILYGTVLQSLYLWLVILICDVTIIGAHGAWRLRCRDRKGPWRIPTPLILRWVCFALLVIASDNNMVSTFAWYLMTYTAVCHTFYCVLLTMDVHNSSWLEGTHGEIGIPNWISITRMALSVLVPHLFAVQSFGQISCTLATIILLAAIITDAADGYIARKLNQCTKAGKALDPLGDKFIFYPTAIAFILATHGTVYLDLAILRWIFYICFAIMLARDVLYIIWFALYYARLPKGMSASMIDKVRMATLCAWLGISALALTIPTIQQRMAISGFVFMLLIAVLSVASFIVDYHRMSTALRALESNSPQKKDAV